MQRKPFTPRTIFATERVEVVMTAPGEYLLAFDAEFIRFFTSAAEAEHAAAMRLEEEANDMANGLEYKMDDERRDFLGKIYRAAAAEGRA